MTIRTRPHYAGEVWKRSFISMFRLTVHTYPWPVIVAFLNSSGVVWTEIWWNLMRFQNGTALFKFFILVTEISYYYHVVFIWVVLELLPLGVKKIQAAPRKQDLGASFWRALPSFLYDILAVFSGGISSWIPLQVQTSSFAKCSKPLQDTGAKPVQVESDPIVPARASKNLVIDFNTSEIERSIEFGCPIFFVGVRFGSIAELKRIQSKDCFRLAVCLSITVFHILLLHFHL